MEDPIYASVCSVPVLPNYPIHTMLEEMVAEGKAQQTAILKLEARGNQRHAPTNPPLQQSNFMELIALPRRRGEYGQPHLLRILPNVKNHVFMQNNAVEA